jgi:DNA polymerase III sliding clamp (beta) subunit (PCNA family)
MYAVNGKIEKVASKDKTRPALTHVNLRTDADGSRWLEATDSYKLIRVPARGATAEDTDGPIPAAVFTAARWAAARGLERESSIQANGSVSYELKEGGSASMPRPDGFQFPDCARLVPEPSAVVFEVGLNAKLLLELAQGLGSDIVRVSFVGSDDGSPNALKPMIVRPQGGKVADAKSVGVLMPVRISS